MMHEMKAIMNLKALKKHRRIANIFRGSPSDHFQRTRQQNRKGGESLFLRKLVLGIPAQASGKNLTRPLMPSAPQTSCVRATSPHHRKLGAG